MKEISKGLYFNQIEVRLNLCSVFSEKADACVVPQYREGVCFKGVSAAMIHSRERASIVAFQKIVAKSKPLPFGETYVSLCRGKDYRFLIQIPVLGASAEMTSFAISAALKRADELELRKVVIPAINTGRSGSLTDKEAANATFNAIASFAKNAKSVREISLNIYEKSTYLAYEKYFS